MTRAQRKVRAVAVGLIAGLVMFGVARVIDGERGVVCAAVGYAGAWVALEILERMR